MSELSIEQQEIFDAYKEKENIFITGPGGCGKSFLLKHIIDDIKNSDKKYSVTALTGCAAILLGLGARTINSWAGIGFAKSSDNAIITNIMMNKYKKKNWIKTQILIIDEVSMMSKHMFELLDAIGKRVRGNTKPFGGIQLILSGDFYQLPPVGDRNNPDSSKFCFESPLWEETFDSQFILDKSFRQKDETYISILNQIREGRLNRTGLRLLQSRVNIEPSDDLITKPVSLNPTKHSVELINKKYMDEIDSEEYIYQFKGSSTLSISNTPVQKDGQTSITSFFKKPTQDISDKSTQDTENIDLEELYNHIKYLELTKKLKEANSLRSKLQQLPTSEHIDIAIEQLDKNSHFTKQLKLKVGCQVMCTANLDIDKGIYNGAVGIVKKCNPTNVEVSFNSGIIYNIPYHGWEHDLTPNITYQQIPLILAWAVTIHKSQGATLEYAELDIGSSVFAEGQTYVALSRIKSLDGLFIKSFDPMKIKTNRKVIEFYKQFEYDSDSEEET